MELMLLESEIMVNVLLRVREHGKVALPLHDGVLTSRSAVPVVKGVMEEAFKEKTGADAVVRVETW